MLTANMHITPYCNYKCSFCYAHFSETEKHDVLSSTEAKLVIDSLRESGLFQKINFAGGEPLLYPGLSNLISHTRDLGLTTSIVTNGSRITPDWLAAAGPKLDILAISCDSGIEKTLIELGRGRGNHLQVTTNLASAIRGLNSSGKTSIYLKLNTVVTRLNCTENMSALIREVRPDRWKIFQMLEIDGENDHMAPSLRVSSAQFDEFVARHQAALPEIRIVPENNEAMTNSYIMVDPEGRFFQNVAGQYRYSKSILDIGVREALMEVGYSSAKFLVRGGLYTIDNAQEVSNA